MHQGWSPFYFLIWKFLNDILYFSDLVACLSWSSKFIFIVVMVLFCCHVYSFFKLSLIL